MAISDSNILYERYRFYQRCQQGEETLQFFVDDVLKLAKICEFNENFETLVRDRILFGLHDEEIKWRIIHRGGNPSLNDVMIACDQYELNLKIEIDEELYDTQQCDAEPLVIAEAGTESQGVLMADLDNSQTNHTTGLHSRIRSIEKDTGHILKPQKLTSFDIDEDDRECPVCYRMIRPANFIPHVDSHSSSLKVVKIVCNNCDAIFESFPRLNTHYEENHAIIDPESNRTKYMCSKCDTSYIRLAKLRIHLTNKHGRPPARIFECRACNASFTEMQQINSHIKIHTKCDICSENCRTEQALRHHKLSHVEIDKPIECFVCHSKHKNISFLRTHMKYAHPVEQFVCKWCDKKFNSQLRLKKHRKSHRTELGSHCKICGKDFGSQFEYEEHMNEHPQCNTCEQNLKSDLHLTRHRISHIGENSFECFECHQRFQTYAQIRKHHKKVHTVTAIRSEPNGKRRQRAKDYLCSQCGACFLNIRTMKMHMMREDHRIAGAGEEKPFHCDVCNKRFRNNTELKDHYRHHTGEKPYNCEICGKCFRSTTSLGEHRQGVHLQRDRHKCQLCQFKCFKLSAFKKHMERKHAVS